MVRLITSVAALSAAMLIGAPAFAADYGSVTWSDDSGGDGQLRSAYPTEPKDWAGLGDEDDPLKFEFGMRYWYSMGASNWSDSAGTFAATDTTHILEGDLRIEDHSTNTFATALAGYSFATTGDFNDPFDTGTVSSGHVGYLGADFGWNALGDNNGSGLGALIGYMYYNDGLLTDRGNFTTAQAGDTIGFDTTTGVVTSGIGFDSAPNNIDINMLRLGASAKADMGFMDVTGTLAAVPYAMVNGVLGNDQTTTTYTGLGNIDWIKGSSTNVNGWGYGAAADVMVRAHPTKNITVGLGGRLWYLQGSVDASYDLVHIGDPTDSDPTTNPPNYDTQPDVLRQRVIELNNPFSMLRYGITAELSYAF